MGLKLYKEHIEVLRALALILDLDGHVKLCHSLRVAVIAHALAENLSPNSAQSLFVAGLIHDIGVFDVSNEELHEVIDFSKTSNQSVRIHPQKGAAIISVMPGFISIARMVMDHHEWVDGSGYPRGLNGFDISLDAQILRIADSASFYVDAGQLDREYVLKAMEARIGVEFSQELYDSLSAVLSDELWHDISYEPSLYKRLDKFLDDIPLAGQGINDQRYHCLEMFGRVLDAKHSYSEGHSRRVAYFSELLAVACGLEDSEVARVRDAAYLHDIGKVAIPLSILDSPRKLTNEEFEVIKRHAQLSQEIVLSVSLFEDLAEIVGADQEHWDGSGYPLALKEHEIPLGSRIIFVADAFDAMTSTRSYRKAMPVTKAIEELRRSSGTDFDPEIVEQAAKLFAGFEHSVFTSESATDFLQNIA